MKRNYEKYLNGEHWQSVKRECLTKDDECRICGRKENLILHHKTYENMWQETEKDFIILCQRCHKKIHFHRGIKLSSMGVLDKYHKIYAHKERARIDKERKEVAKKRPFLCSVRYSKTYY